MNKRCLLIDEDGSVIDFGLMNSTQRREWRGCLESNNPTCSILIESTRNEQRVRLSDKNSFNFCDLIIKTIEYAECLDFCKIWHYSKTCPPGGIYYGVYLGQRIIAVACYGDPAMRNQKAKYDVDIELRRLCCIDDTPKNLESFFISKTLKLLKKLGYKSVLSLADPDEGHAGTIYRACNFTYIGESTGGVPRFLKVNGETMHSRTAHARFGASGYKPIKAKHPDWDVEVINKARKLIYIYRLDKAHSQQP